ncbi:hypothetical protein [Armatimonas sp.]|uniref:hypothetical protein n=1 Tax=Armatimonas sp. TaxID=1872638 RepID=UPI00286C276D|nr:hypothetical protein [Armatimonas sp.]
MPTLMRLYPFSCIKVNPVHGVWFVKRTLPSGLPSIFPEIALSRLVPYYEEGRGLEGEFIESWVGIEHFFADWAARQSSHVQDTLILLRALKAKGYDSKLRAGQSMSTFIISRSRLHGLRTDQSSLAFETWGNKLRVHGQLAGVKISLEYETLTLNDEIEQLVKRLAELPVDGEDS